MQVSLNDCAGGATSVDLEIYVLDARISSTVISL